MTMSFLPLTTYLAGVLAWAAWVGPSLRRAAGVESTDGWPSLGRDIAAGLLWPAWWTIWFAALLADSVMLIPVYLRIVRTRRAARVAEMQKRALARQIRAVRSLNNAILMENHAIRRQIILTAAQRALLREKTVGLERYGDELQALINLRKQNTPPS